MKHRRQRVVGEAAFDIGNSPANANAPVRLPLDPKQQRRHGKHDALRLSDIDGRRRRIVADDAAGFRRRRFAVGAIFPFRRRHEDREQAAGKSSLVRFGKIQMALLLALQNAVTASAPPRRCSRSRTSLWPSKIEMRLGGSPVVLCCRNSLGRVQPKERSPSAGSADEQ